MKVKRILKKLKYIKQKKIFVSLREDNHNVESSKYRKAKNIENQKYRMKKYRKL